MRQNRFQPRFQNTWDSSSMVETSSLNHVRNGTPTMNSGRGMPVEKVQRIRPHHHKKRSKATKVLFLKRHAEIGFGFSIRGGIEHGTGIFVSNINKYSDASNQGLQVGDQILRANKHSFEEITHDAAVQFIQSHRTLRLMVLSLGIIPGSKVEHTQYQWIDCYGRPCSPLPLNIRTHTNGENVNNANGIRLLEEDDERKVNIVVGNNKRLGLLIRGGSEYGLGIFVAGIDEGSVADRSAVMVGEQILEVNGIDFTNISHADAAHIIRTSKMMSIIMKDVGKIPLARVVLDQTEWIDRRSVRSRNSHTFSPRGSFKDSVIQPGIAGSQLHHQSITGPTSYQWIEEKAQYCLSEDEWNTLKYYIREYVHGSFTVNEFVLSLLDLFDTNEKKYLIQEVRGIVRAQDIDKFDEMMLRIEVQAIKMQNEEDSEEDNIAGIEEESVAATRQELGNHSPSPANNGFNYNKLHEESYHSTMENLTEESILHASPLKFVPRNIMDERIIEEEEEPLYAKVNKGRTVSKETSAILRDYDNLDAVKKFTTFSPPSQSKNTGTVPENSDRVTEEERDFEQNKLGFAFNFLNSTDEELESPRNPKTAYSPREESSDDDDESIVTVSSLENGYGTTPPSTVNKGRYFRGFGGESANRRQKSNVLDLDFSPTNETSIQDFQPKYLSGKLGSSESQTPNIEINSPTPELKKKDTLHYKKSKDSNKVSEPNASSFDAATSLEHRYSNFAVNDIMRQSFLPTTRLDYDPLNSSNEEQDYLNRNFGDTSGSGKRLKQVSSLNIQNQYEYEKSEKGKSLSSSAESLTKMEEPKTYGKPIMAKSPRTDHYSSFNSSALTKKIKQDNEKENNFKMLTLKKTKNGELIFKEIHNENDAAIQEKPDSSKTHEKIEITSNENDAAIQEKANFSKTHEKIEITSYRREDEAQQRVEQHLEYRNPYDRKYSTSYKRKPPVPLPVDRKKTTNIDIDLRAADSPPARTFTYEPQKNLKDSIKSRVNVFNIQDVDVPQKQNLKKSTDEKQMKKVDTATERIVTVPRHNDEPGFTLDSRQSDDVSELFISEIQDSSLKELNVGDVISGVDNMSFKKGLQKGLANLIIKNAFNNSESSRVNIHVKK